MSYLAYEPLHINNWMLCYLVPQSKAQEEFQFIGNKEVILFAVIGVGVITFFILIFQRTSMKQKKMREIASRDGLTQLYNKAGTEQRIKEWLHSDRSKAGAVLMMMDVDYFKQINDTYGHAVGDRVLYKVGHLLKSSFRENDIVGRIGGDEFLIFMEGITSEEFAVRRMENLQQYLRELPIEELEEHTLACSMGAAFMPKDGTTFGELYKHADEALYTTKRNGTATSGRPFGLGFYDTRKPSPASVAVFALHSDCKDQSKNMERQSNGHISHLLSEVEPTACRMCSALLQKQQIQYIIIFDRIQ